MTYEEEIVKESMKYLDENKLPEIGREELKMTMRMFVRNAIALTIKHHLKHFILLAVASFIIGIMVGVLI